MSVYHVVYPNVQLPCGSCCAFGYKQRGNGGSYGATLVAESFVGEEFAD